MKVDPAQRHISTSGNSASDGAESLGEEDKVVRELNAGQASQRAHDSAFALANINDKIMLSRYFRQTCPSLNSSK